MQIITLAQAREQKLTRYFTGVPCVNGHVAERTVAYRQCLECKRARRSTKNMTPAQLDRERARRRKLIAKRTPAQQELYRVRDRARKEQDKVRRAEYISQWHKENRAHWRAYKKNRDAMKLNATPAWADLQAIRAVYEEAERLTRETGIKHHVDHIVPLQSEYVCGLHCEANLQVLTESENCSKNNRYWPDMPEWLQ